MTLHFKVTLEKGRFFPEGIHPSGFEAQFGSDLDDAKRRFNRKVTGLSRVTSTAIRERDYDDGLAAWYKDLAGKLYEFCDSPIYVQVTRDVIDEDAILQLFQDRVQPGISRDQVHQVLKNANFRERDRPDVICGEHRQLWVSKDRDSKAIGDPVEHYRNLLG